MDVRYVTDEKGKRIAVQIPLDQWEIIQAELESYDGDAETDEILADPDLVKSIKKGREQARRKKGRRIEEIDL